MIYNVKVLNYRDSLHVEFYTKPIIQDEKKQSYKKTDVIEKGSIKQLKIIEDLQQDIRNMHSIESSVNRSKNNLYRIARSNEWQYFITITFDRQKTDASDYRIVVNRMTKWLNNLNRHSDKKLKYLIVPEFHKDGINYHFHGLLANCDGLELKDSGHVDKFGEKIYNIVNWNFGYTTAVRIRDNGKVTNYIGKYITKDLLNKTKYKRRYFASMSCDIVEEQYYNISESEFIEKFGVDYDYLKTKNIPKACQRVKYIEINKLDKKEDI